VHGRRHGHRDDRGAHLTELWTLTAGLPQHVARAAERAEAAGWHGLAVVDSQNLSGDSYVSLAFAATATTRLGLGTAVTNPVTRHPAVTAGAIASLHSASGGRACLGIGRGDSALAHLGRAPATVRVFERYVEALAAYLRGEAIPFSALAFHEQVAPDVSALGLADTPTASRITWIDGRAPKVPLEVAATGARVIGVAARHADRILFALGADPERIAWGIETARQARRDAGLDPAGIAFGSYVNCAAHADLGAARALVRGGLTTFARFAVMHGTVSGPATAEQREVLGALHRGYDMTRHTRADSPQAELLTPAFVDRYAVVGPPAACLSRLRELAALGLDKFVVIGPTAGADRDAARAAEQSFAAEVLPAFA
jgi:5,10-methylenetetrahydromethanopterin reductase